MSSAVAPAVAPAEAPVVKMVFKTVLDTLKTVPRCLAVGCGRRSLQLDEAHVCCDCAWVAIETGASIRYIPHAEMTRAELETELCDIRDERGYVEDGLHRIMLQLREEACWRALADLSEPSWAPRLNACVW